MYVYNEELRAAAEQVARQNHLKRVDEELKRQREELALKVGELKSEKEKEQADVDKLEGRTLAAFFASVTGKKAEKLQKEKSEAYAAAARYESAVYELESVEQRLRQIRSEIAALNGCKQRYDRIYSECLSRIKMSNSPESERIFDLESEVAAAKNRKKEVDEALREGKRAYEIACEALRHLDSAKSWNNWDLWGGGGMITHFEKHDHLDAAQSSVEYLQAQLRRFKSELADVDIRADMQVSIDGFLRFADYFFDGIFADLAVGERIDEGISRINSTKREITRAIDKLEEIKRSCSRREKTAADSIRAIVEGSGS